MTICHPLAIRPRTSRALRLKFCHQCSAMDYIIGSWEIHGNSIICRHSARRAFPLSCQMMKLLVLREGQFVPVTELVEWMYPDPDLSPENEIQMVRRCVYFLRPTLEGLGMGLRIGIEGNMP